jgi:hypothetical protein
MNHKNLNTYRARFAKLHIHAFGKEQTLDSEFDVEIYQARANPELWLARPASQLTDSEWRASSAEALMTHIETYFEKCIMPWEICWNQPAGLRQKARSSGSR